MTSSVIDRMELGIYTFADVPADTQPGDYRPEFRRLQDLLEEASLADELGLDVFAVGEHHRPDYAVSSPAVVLAAVAARTRNIRLSSAVTVLSSDDPVRVFQQFSTVDLLSGGRVEIMVGRGSFVESFPLFGYDLQEYDGLFAEKLDLLLKLNEKEVLTWEGKHRPPLQQMGVYPRPYQPKLPVWIAIGGTPHSVVRAARLGVPVAIAIIGGYPAQFAPLVRLYRETAGKSGHAAHASQLSINSHVFVADDSQTAADIFFPPYARQMSRIGRERSWPEASRAQFEASRSFHGALLVGSAAEVTEKILHQHELFGHSRFLAQMDVGAVPHKDLMRSIELFGTRVAPAVRKALANRSPRRPALD